MVRTEELRTRVEPGELTAAAYEQPLPSVHAVHRLPQFHNRTNVGRGERIVSGAAGSILALLGLGRRDLPGMLIASVGGALLLRGASGHCSAYQAFGVDTAEPGPASDRGAHITQSFLIDRPLEDVYAYWRNFEQLPTIMSHLEAVHVLDPRRSRWIAKAPSLVGGQVEWEAEITADDPHTRIAWRSLPGSAVDHRGVVRFKRALGDRGTAVTVVLDYLPPAGQTGRWIARILGEEPEQQIREDLRNFKRLMEVGDVLTVAGQPHGTCGGLGKYLHR